MSATSIRLVEFKLVILQDYKFNGQNNYLVKRLLVVLRTLDNLTLISVVYVTHLQLIRKMTEKMRKYEKKESTRVGIRTVLFSGISLAFRNDLPGFSKVFCFVLF